MCSLFVSIILLGTNRRPSNARSSPISSSSGRREVNSDMQPTTVLGSRIQAAESAERAALSEHRWNRVTALWAIESMVDAFAVCVSVLISYEAYAALAQHWG